MQNNRDIFWDDIDKTHQSDVNGKVAVITGGGKGIGRAIAENLLANGAKVIILTRSSGQELADGNDNCSRKTCDVRYFDQVKQSIDEITDEFGRIDILVNAAGIALLTPVKEEPEKLFDDIMDINFKGTRNCVVAAAEHLEKTRGCIINIGSIWGMPGINLVGDATYSAGDAAIIKYSEVLAEELPLIRVNCIAPALVETDMNNDMTEEERNEFAKAYKGRDNLIQPSEVANVAEYIIKSDTNQKTIIIDAGYMERSR